MHEYDRCVFKFFVYHNLEKKYQLSEGNENQTIGSLLDLTLKKIHLIKAYGQRLENLKPLIRAAEIEMRETVLRNGEDSFYGKQIQYLTPEVITKTQQVFANYYQGIKGKFKESLATKTFWEAILPGQPLVKIWGGPDGIEMGEDGIPEVVDYKFYNNQGLDIKLDMDLMPRFYTFLVAAELIRLGYSKARFMVRLWNKPADESFSQEFYLEDILELGDVFRQRIEGILKCKELSFCEQSYCKVCNSEKRDYWILEVNSLFNL